MLKLVKGKCENCAVVNGSSWRRLAIRYCSQREKYLALYSVHR